MLNLKETLKMRYSKGALRMLNVVKDEWRFFAVVAVVAVLFLGSQPVLLASDKSSESVVLRCVGSNEPPSLDPAKTMESAEARVLRGMMYETLIDFEGDTTKLIPNLAKSWTISEDGLVYSFKLQEGITYSNGTPFDAEAVKYTWRRNIGVGESGSAWWGLVESIEVVDEYSFQVTLKYPYGGWLNFLAGANCAVIGPPESYIEEYATPDDPWAAEWLNSHVMGTGPYMLDKWQRGDFLRFAKNPNYWRGWTGKHVDEILIKNVPELSTMRLMLESGESDIFLEFVPADWIEPLTENPNVTVFTSSSSAVIFYFFLNTQNPPLDDIRVRSAIFHAFDFDTAVDKVWFGLAQQPTSILPSWMTCYDPNTPKFEYDLEKAKALLAEAGIKPGELVLRLRQNLANRPVKTKYVLLLMEGLSKIGVTLDIQDTAWSVMMGWTHRPLTETSPYDVMGYWFWGTVMDPDVWLSKLVTCEAVTTVMNSSRYCDPELDKLIQEAAATADREQRCELYSQLQRILYDRAILLPAVQEPGRIAYSKWVKGYLYRPALENIPNWYDIYIEGREEE